MKDKHWIAFENGEVVLTWEPLVFMLAIALLAWLFAKLFLKELSEARKMTLTMLFRNITTHSVIATGMFLLYASLSLSFIKNREVIAAAAFVGIICLVHWTFYAVMLSRLCIFLALYFSNKKVAFPLLLVNIATIVISIVLVTTMATLLLDVQVVPLLATSAVFSIVLGVALQDTLGNLFAGLALQLDKPDEINDWVEILSSGQKWVGKVHEITWRATILVGFGDEIITIPNRIMAQSTICNFSVKGRPFVRAQTLRLPFDVDLIRAKAAINEALLNVEGVLTDPAPFSAIQDTTESWVAIRVIYYISDYSSQLVIGDRALSAMFAALSKINIPLATARILVTNSGSASGSSEEPSTKMTRHDFG